MRWEKKARLGIAATGIACAGGLFLAIGTREAFVSQPPPARLDPTAIIESTGATVQQIRGVKEDYSIKAERQLTYSGGKSKSLNVEISVKGRGGRDFVMTSNEAQGVETSSYVDMTGGVRLKASDGFEIATDRASFSEAEGLVRAPGSLTFHRGGMSGTGLGMTYDKNNDVLTIVDQSRVVFADANGNTTMEFTGGGSTFRRRDHLLIIERSVHALRGEQLLEGDLATAHLTDNDELVTAIELRGNSRVVGGAGALESMSANDIDLAYSPDGSTLERVQLVGKAAAALAGESGTPGQQLFGDTLSIALERDNTVSSVRGLDNVRLDLPATATNVRRSVKARAMQVTGTPGQGLTAAYFNEDVAYQEDAPKPDAAPRIARSRSLTLALTDNTVASATFTGSVTFEDQGLKAGAASAIYDPSVGTLKLTGLDQGGGPRVSDELVSITANAIDVTLEGPRIVASGNLKTILQPQKGKTSSKMPGLLANNESVNVNGGALQYDGGAGRAVYTGAVQLYQTDTAIRGEHVLIDRSTGDLVATGAARSTITLDKGASIGRGEQIRYTDALREIEYLAVVAASPPVAPATRTAPGVKAPAPPVSTVPAQLSSPQGDLRSDRIVVVLEKGANDVERLEGYGRAALKLDTRSATGGRLTYFAADERYVISGSGAELVKVIDRCNETSGRTLTFFKSTDRIIIDGNEEIRTQTKNSGGPCAAPRTP